jgi:hypothetical protein
MPPAASMAKVVSGETCFGPKSKAQAGLNHPLGFMPINRARHRGSDRNSRIGEAVPDRPAQQGENQVRHPLGVLLAACRCGVSFSGCEKAAAPAAANLRDRVEQLHDGPILGIRHEGLPPYL